MPKPISDELGMEKELKLFSKRFVHQIVKNSILTFDSDDDNKKEEEIDKIKKNIDNFPDW